MDRKDMSRVIVAAFRKTHPEMTTFWQQRIAQEESGRKMMAAALDHLLAENPDARVMQDEVLIPVCRADLAELEERVLAHKVQANKDMRDDFFAGAHRLTPEEICADIKRVFDQVRKDFEC